MRSTKLIIGAGVVLSVCFARSIDWEAREIVKLLGSDATPDAVRIFIHDNSVHRMDDEFRQGGHAAKVIAYAKGQSAQPPHMECSTRSNLMTRVLNEIGHRSRKIAIFDTDTNLQSHTFIDVWNTTFRRWETQDANYGIWWEDRQGNRVSLVDYAETPDEILPCSTRGCGWDQAEKLKGYLDIISITDKAAGKRYAIYTSRADLSRIYTDGGDRGLFCELEAKRCVDGFTKAMSDRH